MFGKPSPTYSKLIDFSNVAAALFEEQNKQTSNGPYPVGRLLVAVNSNGFEAADPISHVKVLGGVNTWFAPLAWLSGAAV